MQRITAFLLSMSLALVAFADDGSIISDVEIHHPVFGGRGMVASQDLYASRVGAAVLRDGGNAVDAAVAVGFTLAVTLPRAGNLGGGGFMLIHDSETGENTSVDYREMAPPKASRDMYLDDGGDVDNSLSRYSHLSAGTPGTVAGMWAAHQRYGRLPWKRLLEPAIKLAEEGFTVSHYLALGLEMRRGRLCRFEAACSYFFKKDGSHYQPGDIFRQPDLARTLKDIANKGPDGFYGGRVARLIAAEMQRHGGIVDKEALAAYEAVWREPVVGEYRGFGIVAMAPPSSGGVHIIQMLNVLEHFDVAAMGHGSADSIHLLAETARRAYADRSKHLGDPDFYDVPVDWLTSRPYAQSLAAGIDMGKATPSVEISPGTEPAYESDDTTHFSIIDADGNVVSNTYTLNFSFGSGIAVAGAGFLLNNEMDDFSAKPGTPDAYGLIGGEANAIIAGKRPLSSMTPTMVFRGEEPWFATGSPGGSRIITTVLQMIVNVVDFDMNIKSASSVPRMHHQWYPDYIRLELGFSPDTLRELEARGHALRIMDNIGSLQTVAIEDGVFRGASDPRRPNAASVAP